MKKQVLEFSTFVTGSRCYSKPRPDSDLDMVIMVDYDTAQTLYNLADKIGDSKQGSLCFGKLNLILVGDTKTYNEWKRGTEKCLNKAPVTREEAIAILEAEKKHG
jgi:hypothetical protein